MKASDLFVRCLEQEGVEFIFGIPGEENLWQADQKSWSLPFHIGPRCDQFCDCRCLRAIGGHAYSHDIRPETH